MKRALYNQPDATPCGSTDNRKRNKTANLLHPFTNGVGKLLLTLCLLMTSVSAWAQTGTTVANCYVFNNGTYGYLYNNNGTLATDGTFRASSVWIASGVLGNTARNIKSYTNQTQFLNGSNTNNGSVTIGNTVNAWYTASLSGVLTTDANSTRRYLHYDVNNNKFVTSNGTNRYTPVAITATHYPVSNNATAPTISATISSGNNGVQLSHTNLSGSYRAAYDHFVVSGTNHFWYNNSDHNEAPQQTNFGLDVNYTWSIVSGEQYATISDAGLLQSRGNATTQQTIRVKLTTTHAASGYSNEQTYDVQIQDHAATTVTAGIGDYNIINTVGGNLQLRGFLNGNYVASYTTYTIGGQSHNLSNGQDYGYNTPQVNGGFEYHWSLSGEGTAYATIANTLANNPQLTYTTDAGRDVVVEVNMYVTHPDFPELHVVATPFNVTLYSTSLAAPTISYNEGSHLVTLSTVSEGTTYYTTDGSDPRTSGTRIAYTAPFSVTTPKTIRASMERWGNRSSVSEETIHFQLGTPEITFSSSGVMTVTLANAPAGTTFRYTTDSSEPTTESTLYDNSNNPTIPNGTTVKVKAFSSTTGYDPSEVAVARYEISSGISGQTVTLNDAMDHSWTLFQPQINGETNPIYYANPKDVKITYKANGGAVSISESANQFVYYKTLTDDYKYTTIPNPFSKRPRANGNYQGFSKWKITRISGGTITGLAVNSEVNAETELTFNPTNEYGMEVDFEVVWTRAYVVTCAVDQVNANLNSSTLAGDSYETNFIVITSGTNSNTALTATTSKKVTITMVTPDGANDYRSNTRYLAPTYITLSNDWKFEYINMNNYAWRENRTDYQTIITSGSHYLIMGRGISNSTSGNVCANYIRGLGANVTDINAKMRIESGVYNYFSALRGYEGSQETPSVSGTMHTEGTLGCDYDRATSNNQLLKVRTGMYYGYIKNPNIGNGNTSRETFNYTVKSGDFNSNISNNIADAGESFYISLGGAQANVGRRVLTIEGGQLLSVAGGIDQNNSATDQTVYIRMYGGRLRGSMYGAAAFASTSGHRKFVITGGQIDGWIAGGCNGTQDGNDETYGVLPSKTYIYVGGNAKVGSNTTVTINDVQGGNVFAAGRGRTSPTNSGRVLESYLVIADNSRIKNNAYGGGNLGFALNGSHIYVTGGEVAGRVFGGANLKGGGAASISMTGGKIFGGLYGGSNESGAISGDVTIDIIGGQVGRDGTPANVHGGGYGNRTLVNGNVNITLGNLDAPRDADGVLVYGDVYGGSALGQTNATGTIGSTALSSVAYKTGKVTNVTMNAGYIHGSLYGGALGSNTVAANVYGPVQVKVYGGSVFNTDGSGANGSGAVYGCNNINGEPQRAVTVDIYGTNSAPAEDQYALFAVYGGGNQANYSNGTPVVTVHNCDNSIEYVYGGGNAAHITNGNTDVTIWGGNKIGNVFGGGNGQVTAANISGSTNVKIYGGTIENVFPGSNTNGTIGGNLNLTIEKHAGTDGCEGDGKCPFDLGNVYSGGNKAASKIGNVTIGCLGNGDKITNLFGGAKQANVTGDVNLLITGNHIENVFGGNDISGQPSGTITVVVDWDPTCTGAYLGNVYGGGRDASYEAPNGNKDYPQVFVRNAVVEHDVFGGGLGASALVTGNPQVTVSTQCPTQGHTNDHMVHIKGSLYGGGSAAPVTGNPVVNTRGLAGDAKKVQIDNYVFGGGFGQTAVVTGNTEVNIKGNTVVNKNVYGGGNGGLVTGNTNIVIGD